MNRKVLSWDFAAVRNAERNTSYGIVISYVNTVAGKNMETIH